MTESRAERVTVPQLERASELVQLVQLGELHTDLLVTRVAHELAEAEAAGRRAVKEAAAQLAATYRRQEAERTAQTIRALQAPRRNVIAPLSVHWADEAAAVANALETLAGIPHPQERTPQA